MNTSVDNYSVPASPRPDVASSLKHDKNENLHQTAESTRATAALCIESTVPPQRKAEAADAEGWNSIEQVHHIGGSAISEQNLVRTKALLINFEKSFAALETILKQADSSDGAVMQEQSGGGAVTPEQYSVNSNKPAANLEKSFSAMVMLFMLSCLRLFSDFQKAQMAMAINQLEVMMSQIKAQISELKNEQQKQFAKDLFQAAAEMAGALVTVVTAGATTKELSNKLDLQKANATNMKAAQVNERIDQLQAKAEAQSRQLPNSQKNNGLQRDILKQVDQIRDDTGATLRRTRTEVGNANDAAPMQESSHYKSRGELLSSEVAFINTKQSLFSGIAGLVKATGPIAGGFLQNQATAHQIEAKADELAKELSSNQYRIIMELVAAFRDAFSRMITSLQEVLSQDPANSKASSQRMA